MTPLQRLDNDIDNCTICNDLVNFQKVTGIVRGTGANKIFCIGEAPSVASAESKMAFHGNSINNLFNWFKEAGFAGDIDEFRKSLYLTSVVKCIKPNKQQKAFNAMWVRCSPFLKRQLEAISPKIIVLLGNEAIEKFLGFCGYQGSWGIGDVISNERIFDGHMFPLLNFEFSAVLLPHPSGLSRTMNDRSVRQHVIGVIKANILGAK